jgi:hypothetical protein
MLGNWVLEMGLIFVAPLFFSSQSKPMTQVCPISIIRYGILCSRKGQVHLPKPMLIPHKYFSMYLIITSELYAILPHGCNNVTHGKSEFGK